jgi:hypothetical protein
VTITYSSNRRNAPLPELSGFIIKKGIIKMDLAKLAGLRDWPVLCTMKQVCSFLRFGNFYQKFIKEYSNHTKLLNNLLKRRFTKNPVLMMPDSSQPFQIKSDTLKYASGAVLTQMDSSERHHPVFFLSKTFQSH